MDTTSTSLEQILAVEPEVFRLEEPVEETQENPDYNGVEDMTQSVEDVQSEMEINSETVDRDDQQASCPPSDGYAADLNPLVNASTGIAVKNSGVASRDRELSPQNGVSKHLRELKKARASQRQKAWRSQALKQREQKRLREHDFVSWNARQAHALVSVGSVTQQVLPAAPMPFRPRAKSPVEKKSTTCSTAACATKAKATTPILEMNPRHRSVFHKVKKHPKPKKKTKTRHQTLDCVSEREQLGRKSPQRAQTKTHAETQTDLVPFQRAIKPPILQNKPVEDVDGPHRVAGLSERECLAILCSRSSFDVDKFNSSSGQAQSPENDYPGEPLSKGDRMRQSMSFLGKRLKTSFKALQSILFYRRKACAQRLYDLQHEMKLVKLELKSQLELVALSDTGKPKYSHGPPGSLRQQQVPELKQPPFLGGVKAEKSSNIRALQSKREAQARLDLPQGKENSNVNAWEGSEFKILLLKDLIRKLRYRISFEALVSNLRLQQVLRKLCDERGDLVTRLRLFKPWVALFSHWENRQWLREKQHQIVSVRRKECLRGTFRPWAELSMNCVADRGRIVVADLHHRRKVLWKSFFAWNARLCIIDRYHALVHVHSSHWSRQMPLFRAFCSWRSITFRNKVLALRLHLATQRPLNEAKRIAEKHNMVIPSKYLARSVSLLYTDRVLQVREKLSKSTETLLGQTTRNAIASICVGIVSKATLPANAGDLVGRQQLALHSHRLAFHSYLALGRLVKRFIFDSNSVDNRRFRREAIALMPRQLNKVNQGSLTSKSLGQHINAIQSFLDGHSIVYRPLKARPFLRSAGTGVLVEGDAATSDCDEILALRSFPCPKRGRKWRQRMANEVYRRRTLLCCFACWHENAQVLRSEHRANLLYRKVILRKVVFAWSVYSSFANQRYADCAAYGDFLTQQRLFKVWRAYVSGWKVRAVQGMWSPWSRWKLFTKRQSTARRYIENMGRKSLLRQCLLQWLRVHRRRRLLVSVFQGYEERATKRDEQLYLDPILQEFRLLHKVLQTWSLNAKSSRCEKQCFEQLEAASLLYHVTLTRKVFFAWSSTRHQYGPAMWVL